jgi:hypothetical protein
MRELVAAGRADPVQDGRNPWQGRFEELVHHCLGLEMQERKDLLQVLPESGARERSSALTLQRCLLDRFLSLSLYLSLSLSLLACQ